MKHWQVYIKELKFSLPKALKEDLDILIDDMLFSEMDLVIAIDGKEGTGKSRTARLVGKYISWVAKTQYSVPNIHFTVDDYITFCESKTKGNVNVMDESRQALNKKRSTSRSNVRFTNWLSENRDKHQVHILILPAIHDLDSYISTWRMSLLINCMKGHKKDPTRRSGYKLERGYIRVFENNGELQKVMFNKNKYGYYAYPKKAKYYGRIINHEPFTDEEVQEYKNKKADIRKKKYAEEEKKDTKQMKALKKLVKAMIADGKKGIEIAKITGLDRTTISKYKNSDVECEV